MDDVINVHLIVFSQLVLRYLPVLETYQHSFSLTFRFTFLYLWRNWR